MNPNIDRSRRGSARSARLQIGFVCEFTRQSFRASFSLRELRFATGTFAGSQVRVLVRHVGSDVGPPLPDTDLTTASQDPSVYHAGETNLSGAISLFKTGYTAKLQPAKGVAAVQTAGTDRPDPA